MELSELTSKEAGLLLTALRMLRDRTEQDSDAYPQIAPDDLEALREKLNLYADFAWYIF